MEIKTRRFKLNFACPVAFLLMSITSLGYGQVAPYTTAATPATGSWPSMNNKGTMVWGQLDGNGFWQVWITQQNSPFSTMRGPLTQGNQNHERPAIDDNGDVVYFQDNSGQGAGWEVVLLQPNKQPSVLEFSSANPPSCKPPDDPSCNAWHTAGQNFGIAADGTTITYYDFCTQGTPPSCVRRFDVGGIRTLQCSGGSCDFWGYDYPTINSNGQIAFTDASGNIYYTTTALPQVPGTLFAPGQCPHLADWITDSHPLNPQVVFVQSSDALCTSYGEQTQTGATIESNLLLNTSDKQVPVDNGVWASVNNSGAIAYQTENSNTSPIWFAGNANGVDLNCPAQRWADIESQYAPRFVVADAWGGINPYPAEKTLSDALLANPDLEVAAYAVLNMNPGAPSPQQQMQTAVIQVGNQMPNIKFMVIDLESGYYSESQQPQNVDSIISAISYLKQQYGLNSVLYSNPSDWQNATGNSKKAKSIGSCGQGGLCIPFWNARYDAFPDLFDDDSTGIPAPWHPIGGWTGRAGKQYAEDCSENKLTMVWHCKTKAPPHHNGVDANLAPTNPCPKKRPYNEVDLDVFDLSLFQ
jgi:hypothetical protein